MAFRAPGENEYTGTQFAPAAPDTYRVRVDRYEIKSGPEAASRFNPDGNPRVRFFLEPLEIDGDPEAMMVDINDEPLDEEKFFIFFFDPDHLGLKPQVAKSRKFLAAALGVPVEQPVEADTLEAFCESLLNRELIVDVAVKGEYNNITDSRPLRKKTRQRRQKADLTEAAEEVFNETPDTGDEDDY